MIHLGPSLFATVCIKLKLKSLQDDSSPGPILSKVISEEQFGFLEGRQKFNAIGIAQEALHSIKKKILPLFAIMLDLSMAYDRVG